jgi:predicted esterase YcpF (UPF0227 family)
MILYLHGFLSSPASAKAQQLRAALARAGHEDDFLCPPLPVGPRLAADVAMGAAQLEDPRRLVLVGSSLGGYYATWIAERTGCRAVLLNPAVRPYELLRARVGWQTDPAGGGRVEIRPEYLDELRALETPAITKPERYWLIAATGDQVIDYREMVAKYADCPMRILSGSDHALTDFAQLLPEVLHFCGIAPEPR